MLPCDAVSSRRRSALERKGSARSRPNEPPVALRLVVCQIKIMPPELSGLKSLRSADSVRPKTFFVLQALKATLPSVIVQGIPSVNRAVINVQEQDSSKTGGNER